MSSFFCFYSVLPSVSPPSVCLFLCALSLSPPSWAVVGSAVKCLHARLCCTELHCGSPGKNGPKSWREWLCGIFLPSEVIRREMLGRRKGNYCEFIRYVSKRQDEKLEAKNVVWLAGQRCSVIWLAGLTLTQSNLTEIWIQLNLCYNTTAKQNPKEEDSAKKPTISGSHYKPLTDPQL